MSSRFCISYFYVYSVFSLAAVASPLIAAEAIFSRDSGSENLLTLPSVIVTWSFPDIPDREGPVH